MISRGFVYCYWPVNSSVAHVAAFRKVRHVSAGTYGLLFDTAAGDILRMGRPATAAGGAEGALHADTLLEVADLERHVQRDARRRRCSADVPARRQGASLASSWTGPLHAPDRHPRGRVLERAGSLWLRRPRGLRATSLDAARLYRREGQLRRDPRGWTARRSRASRTLSPSRAAGACG